MVQPVSPTKPTDLEAELAKYNNSTDKRLKDTQMPPMMVEQSPRSTETRNAGDVIDEDDDSDIQRGANDPESISRAIKLDRKRNPLYNSEIRHGLASEYESEQFMNMLAEIFYLYFENKRHDTGGNPKNPPGTLDFPEWRIKERQRTVNAAIVLCLNIGVDPPDVIKTQPCAKLEAWIDPNAFSDTKKALEQIGKNLQQQYEVLSMRTKYKQALDPIVDDIKKFCVGLRRNAREERVLFHYNGHGVPRPTPSGEIWVFNRGYTQYIPVPIYDLQTWLGAPCIYTFDCHGAGNIVTNFLRFVEKRKAEAQQRLMSNGSANREQLPTPAFPPEAYESCILLASCRANEVLPMHPSLPADLFTCCLTSPISIAVRWFCMQSPLPYEAVDLTIPGRIGDRKTPLGELNWIFTAITDTIAWSTLEPALFKRLFRQDLVVAALFRNFLLAERIMRAHNCHPVSHPKLPKTHDHPMWDAWDLAVDHCLVQLPWLQEAERLGKPSPYQHSRFFEQQLTAFEYWLKYQSQDLDKPPEQLPVLLQVLLSQSHRLRALILLSKYLDLGPKAVHQALSIGIFPYVLKLLQSPAAELKPVLIFIWARIMAVDYQSVQSELLKENGYTYFLNLLVPQQGYVINSASLYEHLAMCAFIVTLFTRGFKTGQKLVTKIELFRACVSHLSESDSPLLRQWICLLFSQVWDHNPDGRELAIQEEVIEHLCELLEDPVPEVRTSCVLALTTFLQEEDGKQENALAVSLLGLTNDASSIVRREVVVFFSKFVKLHINKFLVCAFSYLEEEVVSVQDPEMLDNVRLNSPAYGSVHSIVWRALLILTEDPYREIADLARDVIDYVMIKLEKSSISSDHVAQLQKAIYSASQNKKSALGSSTTAAALGAAFELKRTPTLGNRAISTTNTFDEITASPATLSLNRSPSGVSTANGAQPQQPQSQSQQQQHNQSSPESKLTSTLRRSVSFAASIKNYAFGNGATDTSPSGSAGSAFATPAGDTTPSVTTVPWGTGLKPRTVRYKPAQTDRNISLPLNSGFFDWCCEHFQEPQMCHQEGDEPGSKRYLERNWRRARNEGVIAATQGLGYRDLAVCGSWNSQIAFLNNVTQPVKLLYAQFEPHLIACDDRDGVTVWDWTESNPVKLNRFCNGNPLGTRITDAKFLNEDDQPLLMTGSSEGVVRIYRHYEDTKQVELATAWRVLSDLAPISRTPGLITEWQQSRGTLLVAGDMRVIRVWDAPRELCAVDIPARSGSLITSLSSDQVAGNIVVAGFSDGALRVYDRRIDPRNSLVRTWRQHDSSIINVHMQRGGPRELASGSSDGRVRLWDLRLDTPIEDFATTTRGQMRAMAVHDNSPVIATATNSVSIWSTRAVKVSSIKAPTSAGYSVLGTGSRSYDVSAVAFHPHRTHVAVNNGHDAHISIFKAGLR